MELVKMVKKDVLSILDIKEELLVLLENAREIKAGQKSGEQYMPLAGKTLGMIFEKSSTRTRISFEVGMTQLGGHAIYMNPKDMQMGRGETTADTAKVLSRYCDAIVYRAFKHDMMKELAENATVPVINALDDREHPCQIMADLLTVIEHKGDDFGKLKMTYVGDGNNVCNSLLLGCAVVGMNMTAACPKGYWPNEEILAEAKKIGKRMGAKIEIVEDPMVGVEYADVIYTDVWVSMGDEKEEATRLKAFKPYQVNDALVATAKRDAIIMHCLPAHRGLEIAASVMDGPQSVVFDEAENRLHAQKALLVQVIK
jgi:ornithine carbamoyltransferase